MRSLREYQINFVGLSLGTHRFEFEVGDAFFEHFNNDELRDVKIQLEVELEKKSNMLQLQFTHRGTATVSCDRCLEDMTIPLHQVNLLIVKFGDADYAEQTDDIVVISPNEYQIDISQFVYEYILVDVPLGHSHEPSECNPEVLKALEKYAVGQQNNEPEEDPRWAPLKKNKNE
ncbi:MAG TPA: DUF177 domain-containing protein [Luteibaculaceae bacterium]|nr:DUF177 domain-containing protein [Luteibaculaceae bacterium]